MEPGDLGTGASKGAVVTNPLLEALELGACSFWCSWSLGETEASFAIPLVKNKRV